MVNCSTFSVNVTLFNIAKLKTTGYCLRLQLQKDFNIIFCTKNVDNGVQFSQ